MSQSASNYARHQQGDNNTSDDLERQMESHRDVLGLNAGQDWSPPKQRTWGCFRRPRGNTGGIPLKRTTTVQAADSSENALRLEAIELLFGSAVDCVLQWPGIFVFCRHLESCFEELLKHRYGIIWDLLSQDFPSVAVNCWPWCIAVIKAFQALQDNDPSMEDMYQRLLEDAKKSSHNIKANERIEILRAMFAVLCWTSATLKPLLDDEGTSATTNVTNADAPAMERSSSSSSSSSTSVSVMAEYSSHKHASNEFERPISKMISSFRNHESGAREWDGTQGTGTSNDDALYHSSLNYYSLSTIGRVRLKWVDTLSAHLAFDFSSHTLSIFRFPSFCAASVLRKKDVKVKVLESITTVLLPQAYYVDSSEEPSSLHREVLLSYRLLFGQSSRSRKLLSQLLGPSSTSTVAPRTHSHSGNPTINDSDPLLPTLCTAPLFSHWPRVNILRKKRPPPLTNTIFPVSALDPDNQLQERDTYSARDNFTVFGPRLLTLQRYNMRQQPSRVKDLWRDRRNPLQWYTFWIVLWIGGATVVFAVLQLLVGVAQLYFIVRPTS